MLVLLFPALLFIQVFERYIDTPHNRFMRSFFPSDEDGSEDDPAVQNPVPSVGEIPGMEISRVAFEEIVKVFPDPMAVRTRFKERGGSAHANSLMKHIYIRAWKVIL